MKRETMTAADGKEIALAVWDEVASPKGIVQIVHGMAEHVARYDDFAKFLNAAGYIVAGDDHRAHGLTDKDALGKPGEGDLFEKTVADERAITRLLKERYNLPLVLLGHSYGSFLTQRYLTYGTEELAGCVLSGSARMEGFVVSVGYSLAKSKSKKHADEPGETFAKMTFHKYDKKFREGLNGWLSRDLEQVGRYNTDPLCNFTCSNGFYQYFFKGLKSIAADTGVMVGRDLKLLITSGDRDMVGACGKLVLRLAAKYEKMGLRPRLKLYPGARHEIVNETNRAEVYDDLKAFIDSCF